MSAWSGGYSDGPEASAALLCARAAVPLHRARHCLVTGGGNREGRIRPSRTLPSPRPGGSAQVIDDGSLEVGQAVQTRSPPCDLSPIPLPLACPSLR